MAHFTADTGRPPMSSQDCSPPRSNPEKRATIASLQAWRTTILDPHLNRIRRQEAIWSQSLDGRRA